MIQFRVDNLLFNELLLLSKFMISIPNLNQLLLLGKSQLVKFISLSSQTTHRPPAYLSRSDLRSIISLSSLILLKVLISAHLEIGVLLLDIIQLAFEPINIHVRVLLHVLRHFYFEIADDLPEQLVVISRGVSLGHQRMLTRLGVGLGAVRVLVVTRFLQDVLDRVGLD